MNPSGPYLKIAAFCDKVLQEQDGVISLIRVIDQINSTAKGPGAPKEMPPLDYQIFAVISLKSGSARGKHTIAIKQESPAGLMISPAFEQQVVLEGEERGHNLVVNMQLKFDEEGLYWFHVLLDDELLTKMPLRVTYLRSSGPS